MRKDHYSVGQVNLNAFAWHHAESVERLAVVALRFREATGGGSPR